MNNDLIYDQSPHKTKGGLITFKCLRDEMFNGTYSEDNLNNEIKFWV